MSAYLKQTSTVTAENRRNTAKTLHESVAEHMQRPFEVASDEDLLASNFDRISKILPNHE